MSEIETIKWIMEQGFDFTDAAYIARALITGKHASDAIAEINKAKEAMKKLENPNYKELCYLTQDEWDVAMKKAKVTMEPSIDHHNGGYTVATDYGVTREQTGKSFNETYPTTPKRCC